MPAVIIPDSISVLEGAFATDGGSITLLLSDPAGNRHSLLLSQHLLPFGGYPGERWPGRLFFDGKIIGVRSEEEASIVSALKQADIKPPSSTPRGVDLPGEEGPSMIVGDDIMSYFTKVAEGPEAALRHLVTEVIEYVRSEDYVTLAGTSDHGGP